MIKEKFSIFFVIIFVLLFFKCVYSQEDMFFVSNECFDKPVMPQSVFKHDSHNIASELYECNICHHVYDDNKKKINDDSSIEYFCSDCHLGKSDGNSTKLRNAFHVRCKSCHIDKIKGPLACGDCHSK